MTTATKSGGVTPSYRAQGSPKPVKKNRRQGHVGRLLRSILAIVLALIWVFPVYWMINSAFLPKATLEKSVPTWVPFGGSIDNFISVITGSSFRSALGMSLVITLTTLTFTLLFAFLAALAISRFRFKGRKSFILAVLIIQMLPAEGMFIAQSRMLASWGLTNNFLGVSIIYIAAVVPFTVWMLRGFVAGVPIELEEAAMVDGLSRTKAFFRITFPLLAPGLISAGVYAFLQAWNEFTIALVVLIDQDKQSLPIWLRTFISASANRGTDWGEVMAASTLIAIPVIVFFLIVQGRMTSGLVSGAVKG